MATGPLPEHNIRDLVMARPLSKEGLRLVVISFYTYHALKLAHRARVVALLHARQLRMLAQLVAESAASAAARLPAQAP